MLQFNVKYESESFDFILVKTQGRGAYGTPILPCIGIIFSDKKTGEQLGRIEKEYTDIIKRDGLIEGVRNRVHVIEMQGKEGKENVSRMMELHTTLKKMRGDTEGFNPDFGTWLEKRAKTNEN
ncbi:TPA: hypothetical protein NGR93_004448 [Vibrio parahaemolyticus]|nr:hypothetical protein [Vibrio parahaemolyticus]